MSSFLHWFIIIPTVLSMLGCWWLIWYAGKQGPDDDRDDDTTGHTWDGLTERNTPLPRWWLTLFNLTIVFGIVYLVLYPGLGNFAGINEWTQIDQYEQESDRFDAAYNETFGAVSSLPWAELSTHPVALETGARLFSAHCTTCHGSDAGGAIGFPDLTDSEWQWPNDYDDIAQTIRLGREGVMPPWSATLGEQGTLDMVEYIKGLSGMDHWPSKAARVSDQWAICAACHGASGEGNQALGGPDLTNDAWLYGKSDEEILITLTEGRHGQMPPHEGILNEDKIRFLTVYVKSLSEGQ